MPGLSEDRFLPEVQANLNAPKHDRIVRLLTAFSHRKKFCLVFPFASEGSLEKLWKNYTSGARWYSDGWLINECLGITEALVATHGVDGHHPEPTHGFLHADLKPENILCFRNSEAEEPCIVLKLSDFGEAKRLMSNDVLQADRVAHVKTYRPPEHYPGGVIKLNYDVWCLGCLFLDFITWAILGPDGLESFSKRRMGEQDEDAVTEVPGQVIEDTFFKRVKYRPARLSFPKIRYGLNKTKKVGPGRATTGYSLWAASQAHVATQLKDVVFSVSNTDPLSNVS